ncbi:olfactory receptor 52N4-like [Pelodiscus sinensis]|uniref:olfactory receptor 52N4-like n=1 Tax=Pelodiscus sinensis TaxID=13735 RepID=UPI003F6D0C53
MVAFNRTPSHPSMFILMGIPGLEDTHVWFSIPFATCYVINLVGNFSVLYVVGKEQALHKPMYLMLCMLSLSGIILSTTIMPKALCIFWFSLKDITVGGCLIQVIFLSMVSMTQSAILVTMAFDRYVAICNPLRYTSILTNARTATLGLVSLIRGVLLMVPLPLLLSSLPFCANRIIPHTYCEPVAVAKISCGDLTGSRIYGLVIAVLVTGIDLMLIALSYGLILKAIFKISSKNTHLKALHTCTAHVCVMLTYYTPSLFTIMTHRFGQGISLPVHIILANLHLLIPPMLNPIIYGIKTKELRDKMSKYFCRM